MNVNCYGCCGCWQRLAPGPGRVSRRYSSASLLNIETLRSPFAIYQIPQFPLRVKLQIPTINRRVFFSPVSFENRGLTTCGKALEDCGPTQTENCSSISARASRIVVTESVSRGQHCLIISQQMIKERSGNCSIR